MSDIHSCSYFCDRPACVRAQRDELRGRIASLERELAAAREDAEFWAARAKERG